MTCLTLWTDGGARGNPGPAGIGVVIRDASNAVVAEIAQYVGETTNNQAEYQALIAGLERALELGAREAIIHSDSELMVRQLEGTYRVKNEGLKPVFTKAKLLIARLDRVEIRHVRRELNCEADALVNQAIDAHAL